jgi:hypothetical protein
MRVWLFATARSNVTSPCGNRTQYVLYSVVAPRKCSASLRGSLKWNEATLTRSPNGFGRSGWPVSVFTPLPDSSRRPVMYLPV